MDVEDSDDEEFELPPPAPLVEKVAEPVSEPVLAPVAVVKKRVVSKKKE